MKYYAKMLVPLLEGFIFVPEKAEGGLTTASGQVFLVSPTLT